MTTPDHRILETKPAPLPQQEQDSPFVLPSEQVLQDVNEALGCILSWRFTRAIALLERARTVLEQLSSQPQETAPEAPASKQE